MKTRRVYNKVYSPELWEQVNPQSRELLDDFMLDLKQKKRSPVTINQYFCDLRGFLCYLVTAYSNRFVLELTRKDLRRYALALIEERGVSNARRNVLIASLHTMLEYAEEDEDWNYEINASRMIRSLSKEPIKPIVFVTDDQVMYLFNQLMERQEYQKATLLMLAYESAGRRNELAQVGKDSFQDPSRNNTNQVIGKGRKKFNLVYFETTRQAALRWLAQRGEDDIPDLFIVLDPDGTKRDAGAMDIYYMFKSMRAFDFLPGDAELEFGTHSMRHSALTNYKNGSHNVCRLLGKAGFSIDQLQALAHHDSPSTTQGYLPDITNEQLEEMFSISIQA
jgi:integrase/recombinase XerD